MTLREADRFAGEVGKVLGENWKKLTPAQRAPYDKKALADKKRYEDEKAAYQAVSSILGNFVMGIATNKLQGGVADDDEEEDE